MTEFRVETVVIDSIEKHPNADSLDIVMVHGGYPCIVRHGDFRRGEVAVYIPVDSLVRVERPEFAFLARNARDGIVRIKAKRLRGIFSMGLLVKSQAAAVGIDMAEALQVDKWVPPSERESPKSKPMQVSGTSLWPKLKVSVLRFFGLGPVDPPHVPIYDIEGLRRNNELLKHGEMVVLTEKIHGCNARFIHDGKRLHVGSRTQFRSGTSVWHTIAERYGLSEKLQKYPGYALLGEIYGEVQDLTYGVPKNEAVRFAAFDVIKPRKKGDRCEFMSHSELLEFCHDIGVPVVPSLYAGPWSSDLVSYAEGQTVMPGASHVREGFVVKPLAERYDNHFGRVILKMPGEGYLMRKG